MSRTPMHRPKVRCYYCGSLVVARKDGQPIRHQHYLGASQLRAWCPGWLPLVLFPLLFVR